MNPFNKNGTHRADFFFTSSNPVFLYSTVGFVHESERGSYQRHGEDYEDNDDYDSYDSDEEEVWSHSRSSNNNDVRVVQGNASNKQKTTLQPQSKQFGKFVGKIKLEKYEGMNILLIFLFVFLMHHKFFVSFRMSACFDKFKLK